MAEEVLFRERKPVKHSIENVPIVMNIKDSKYRIHITLLIIISPIQLTGSNRIGINVILAIFSF